MTILIRGNSICVVTYIFICSVFLAKIGLPGAYVTSKQVVLVIMGSLGSGIQWKGDHEVSSHEFNEL